MSQQIVILDSTQIDAYDTCPSLWLYGYHESLEQGEGETKDAMAMGTLGHLWMENYYHQRALGKTVTESTENAFAICLRADDLDKDPQDAGAFPLDPERRKIVLERCNQYWMTYSNNDFIPSCREEYAITIDPLTSLPIDSTKKVPLVEKGFSYELFNSPEYLFILEGRIDLIAPMGNSNGLGFIDHKFQLRERNLYPKSIQFKNYALATGLNLGIINYVRLHKEVSNKTFKRDIIAFNSQEIRAWRGELIDIYINVAKNLKGDHKYDFPRRRSQCSGKFGYACQFTHICEEPNREVGEMIKIQSYKKKKEWKPW
jgi:hypothetical protein